MKAFRAFTVLLISIFILNGCTGMPEIQNMAYATAIGVDFKDGKWIAYAQILNFSNISHSEQVSLGSPVPVWVGEGKGDTLALALTDISRSSQMRVFWGHIKAVVMTENVLKKDVTSVYRAINRYREVRYNILVFATKRKLMDILTQKSILNLSPLSTIMYADARSNAPYSIILPVTGYQAIANLNEPGDPGFIPSIDMDKKDWTEDKNVRPMMHLSGGYFFHDNQMIGWMSDEELLGIRWFEGRLRQRPIEVSTHGVPAAILAFTSTKTKIKPVLEKDVVRYHLEVKVNGFVMELLQDVAIPQLKQLAADAISKEIISTYNRAVKLRCDPLRLQLSLYRTAPREFNRLSSKNPFFLSDDSLGEIHVKVNLINTGKYKGTKG